MEFIIAWAATVVVFLALDAVWLKTVMGPLFRSHIGPILRDDPKLGVALGFYVIYCVGIVYFAALPAASWLEAARDGAILGLMAYGTYEATNMSTVKGWAWPMVISDTAWGTALTAVSAVAGHLALGWWAGA